MPGNETFQALKREFGDRLPATSGNALTASEFPHCGKKEPYGAVKVVVVNSRGSVMPERPKPARKSTTMTARKAGSARKRIAAKQASPKRWSQRVTRESNALDLEQGVFTLHDPKRIAASLKRSAERSSRRKAGPYRSALSMLTFYINRAGKSLPKTQRDRLQRAKTELKRQFHRDE